MFSAHGPSLRELCVQAMTSVERGYDLLAPTFDHTPFRTPQRMLTATTEALTGLGPFHTALDVCTGTGAGLSVLSAVCDGPITGVDFSTGMLARAHSAHPAATLVRADARALPFNGGFDLAVSFGALGHFLPAERPALFEGVHRALNPGGLFAFAIGTPPPILHPAHWVMLGFDTVMRVRNAVWRPPFVMYYRTTPPRALRDDLAAAGFAVDTKPLPSFGSYPDGTPRCLLILARKS
ncbi:class I SAM-dependent DNA methyltransferase [Catenuloplanes sp. NPDC051500]|uniref:class I SAM-dependent DNA methyltransferase n=1 Tax=Catenuloplanes sp. NPDC051500 TaxID=3363959 RepID=UPI003788D471